MAANRAATVAATKEDMAAAMAVDSRAAMVEVKEATRAVSRAAMEAATVPKEDKAAMAAATKEEEDKVTVIREDIREDNKVIMEEGVREVIMEEEIMEMMVDMEMEEDMVEATRITEQVVIRAAMVEDKEVTSRVDNKVVTRPQLRLAAQHPLLLPHRQAVQEEVVDRTTVELHLHRVDKEDITAAEEDRVVTLVEEEVDRATTTPEVEVVEGDRDTEVNELLFEHTDHGTRSNNHDHEVMKPC